MFLGDPGAHFFEGHARHIVAVNLQQTVAHSDARYIGRAAGYRPEFEIGLLVFSFWHHLPDVYADPRNLWPLGGFTDSVIGCNGVEQVRKCEQPDDHQQAAHQLQGNGFLLCGPAPASGRRDEGHREHLRSNKKGFLKIRIGGRSSLPPTRLSC